MCIYILLTCTCTLMSLTQACTQIICIGAYEKDSHLDNFYQIKRRSVRFFMSFVDSEPLEPWNKRSLEFSLNEILGWSNMYWGVTRLQFRGLGVEFFGSEKSRRSGQKVPLKAYYSNSMEQSTRGRCSCMFTLWNVKMNNDREGSSSSKYSHLVKGGTEAHLYCVLLGCSAAFWAS